jgi:hypothetical protein
MLYESAESTEALDVRTKWNTTVKWGRQLDLNSQGTMFDACIHL